MEKNTPKPGELWEKMIGEDPVCRLFYEKKGELWGVWLGVPWGTKKIEEEIIDGENNWTKVYCPVATLPVKLN